MPMLASCCVFSRWSILYDSLATDCHTPTVWPCLFWQLAASFCGGQNTVTLATDCHSERWQRTASATVDSDCAAGAAKGTGRGRSLKCGLPRKHLYRRIPASSCMVLCAMIAGNGLPHSYVPAHTSFGILPHLFAVGRTCMLREHL